MKSYYLLLSELEALIANAPNQQDPELIYDPTFRNYDNGGLGAIYLKSMLNDKYNIIIRLVPKVQNGKIIDFCFVNNPKNEFYGFVLEDQNHEIYNPEVFVEQYDDILSPNDILEILINKKLLPTWMYKISTEVFLNYIH